MTDIEKLALRISERKTSCKKCVYESGPICLYPHTDAHIIDNNINPCFEGVYKHLMEQERKKLRYSAMDIYKDIESFAGTFEIPLSEAIEIYKIAVLSDIRSELMGVQDSIEELY